MTRKVIWILVDAMEYKPTAQDATPSFEELASFIREWARIPTRVDITPETLFEDDLGITGDDGCELLEATAKRFRVCLSFPEDGYRGTFDLAPHEFLFHSEGLPWGLSDIIDLFRPSSMPPSVRAFRVGELFEAVRKAPSEPVSHVPILGLET
jgi:hypothetical protein